MAPRAYAYLWASVAAATFLTGSVYDTLSRPGATGTTGGVIVLAVSLLGLALALSVAARIIVFDARRRP